MIRLLFCVGLLASQVGCGLLPTVVHQPTFHNPFPQLSKVAIAPFFNLSAEPAADGRQFALAYYNELQLVQGYDVVPVGVVETALKNHKLSLGNPDDVRRLAQILEVDAVVIGVITDFSPYYPPRCGLKVEWYAANPCFHPIPPGYGLPWGTPQEEFIPAPLVLETDMALARAQLDTQTPKPVHGLMPVPQHGALPEEIGRGSPDAVQGIDISHPHSEPTLAIPPAVNPNAPADATSLAVAPSAANLPPDWPDPRGLLPSGPVCERPECQPNNEPVLSHTRTYNGHDVDFTAALSTYVLLRDDARFGGWQSYLQRSDDFIRFCCYKHIAEMLTARGGAGETRVVWRWPDNR